MLFRPVDLQLLIFPHLPDIHCMQASLPCCLILFQNFQQIFLPVIADNQIHRRVLLQLLSLFLGIAAHRSHYCPGVQLLCPVQHLPGFPVRDIRHCAGVDNIQIRSRFKGNDFISVFFQYLLHSLQLIGIYLAAQIVQRRLFAHISLRSVFASCPFSATQSGLPRLPPFSQTASAHIIA